MAASPLAAPDELGGVEEFSMDIDSGPEAARREARRRKATGAAESRAARFLCFAPLAGVGHPLVTRETEEAKGLLTPSHGIAQGLDMVSFILPRCVIPRRRGHSGRPASCTAPGASSRRTRPF